VRLNIRNVRAIEGHPPEVPTGWQKQKAYSSPDAKQTLWVESLGEFAMGSRHYALRIGDTSVAFKDALQLKVPGKEKSRIDSPDHYQPWSCDSRSLLICPYGSPPTLLDLDSRRSHELRVEKGALLIALCSLTRPLAFLAPWEWPHPRATNKQACFVPLDRDLSPSAAVSGPVAFSYAVWLGDLLLFLQQEPWAHCATLKLLDPIRSQTVAEVDVSPDRLLPYDSSRIRKINIVGFRSPSGRGSWGLAFNSLDVWSSCQYVVSKTALLMRVGRPAGEPHKVRVWLQRAYEIPIKFVWVEVELDFEG
jgi:hypothetical protein